MTGLAELEHRVAQLDEGLSNPAASRVPPGKLISHFITVMQQVADHGQPAAVISATEADSLQRECRLLQRIAGQAPQIVDGPLAADSQYWVGTGNPDHRPESIRTLSEAAFVPVSDGMRVAAKPFMAGLFTSTGLSGDYGMWSRYLRLNQGSSLHPLPWHIWHARPCRAAVVREIASAAAWVDLITEYPVPLNGLIQPDWASIARSSDAVHMTLRAITATQGLSFRTRHGASAAAYWDVESTFWLRWRFESADLIEITK